MNTRTKHTPFTTAFRFVCSLVDRTLARAAAALPVRAARRERSFDALACEANAMTPGPVALR